ncbi:amino acid ABC transporter substrate-binding protein [Hahella sp. CCB-MM4]|uniref:substrate-binding periplasmic protein n=1 Tax=Hahella sp. (strain CCB-MM4) TaxID=1926491 RepID=UPI000B9B9AB2|nr:ABC transporter substrate-binding protein [Hahella sp. CCB-MM4]OZG72372.1 amino acid ABC transporter substrate-binding protein [Hahella sp. CCB-MM4]
MNLRRALIGLCAGLVVVTSGQYAAAEEKLNIFTENYPPYNMSLSGTAFAHKEEDIAGLCTDVVKALMKRTKLDYRLKLRNWATGLSRAKTKPNHAIFCAARTEDREPFFHWIGPLANIDWTLYAKPGSTIKLNNLDDAKKYRIGGYKDDVMSNYLIERGFNVSTMANDSLNPRRLVLDQIDLWVTDGLAGPYVASEEDITDLVPVLTFRHTPLYMAVNVNSDPKVVKTLETNFKAMEEAGEVEAMSKPYEQ